MKIKNFKIFGDFNLKNPLYQKQVRRFTLEELKFDLGENGDITTNLVLGEKNPIILANIIAKENGVLAGMKEILWFLETAKKEKILANIKVLMAKKDGEKIKKGEIILKIKGHVKDILKVERVVLNFLQRMSGVASLTHEVVNLVDNKKIIIAGTRKTLWGIIDKKAVVVGGGWSHRLNLGDAVLMKDNHWEVSKVSKDCAIREICSRLRSFDKGRFLEIEVEDKESAILVAKEFKKINIKKPKIIMLDNFTPEKIKKTIFELKKLNLLENIYIEASGGITIKNVQEYAKTGVDIISMGSLTHSVKGLDMSLEVIET